ncbi:MAG: hypothetical protein AAF517_20530, partial [Planctomycetota bacterium]
MTRRNSFRKRSLDRSEQREAESRALTELDRAREPLFRELQVLERNRDYNKGREPHRCCTREFNQMRITPLEANAIAKAFKTRPELRRRLSSVMRRLERALPGLSDNDERQNFDCPLLEGTRCLVHESAKPIGCTAWHPPEDGQDARFTDTAWRTFATRDELNDRVYGKDWKLRVIPLWLKRVFRRELKVFQDREKGQAGPRNDRQGERGEPR